MTITKLEQIADLAKSRSKRIIAIAAAQDEHVLESVKQASEEGFAEPLLFGDKKKIKTILTNLNYSIPGENIVHVQNESEAAFEAARAVSLGHAQVLMKGLVSSGDFLRAVIQKDYKLIEKGLLSHVAFFETPAYAKLLCVTDAAMNIAPTLEEKADIINNAVKAYSFLGISTPKVAVISAIETVNPKIESSVHASLLATMNKRKQIKNCIVDGPLALDNAISKEAAVHKGIESDVAGDADILMLPEITSGNVLYKSLNFLGGANTAAVIMGAKVPVILTSRADSTNSKYYSIALACAMQ